MKKSVCEIFQTMDTSDSHKITENVEVKEWLKNFKETDIHPEATEKNLGFDPSSWKLKIKNIVSSLEVNWEFLAFVLKETMYDLADSKEIVSVFCKDLNFYFGIIENDFFYINGQESVDLHVGERDLYIFGRLIAPLLIAGYAISIYPINTSVLPYLAAIGHLITKAGLPKGTKYILKPSAKITNDLTRFVIGAEINSHYCPVVIFDDADLDSALDCLVDSCHKFNGMLYWSVTHVYIQESIYDKFVSKLKERSKRMHQIILISCNRLNKLKHNLENKILTFCVGWDPRDFELNSSLEMTVSILPFRTNDEVISLVNSQNIGCAASLWTEKISIANRVSKSLKIGTIWINSHGNIDSMIPLESFNESHLPLNGVQLCGHISSLIELNSIDLTRHVIPSISEKKIVHFSKSVEEAVNYCQRGYDVLSRFDDITVQNILDSIISSGFRLSKDDFPLKSTNADVVYHPSSKIDVLSFSCPYQVVMVVLATETVPSIILLQIFYHLIESRNAAIICAPSSLLNDIKLLLPFDLLPEIITLLDIKNYSKSNEHTKRIGKIFYYDCKNVKISKDLNLRNSLNSIFRGKKSIWMPTY